MTKNKVVLITGGAGRIGSSLCRAILESGGRVIISDKDSSRGKALEEELSTSEAVFLESDTTNIQSIDALISKSEEIFNEPINCSVHCAYPKPINWGKKFEELSEIDLNESLSMQLGSAIIFSQKIIEYFVKNGGGNLIHISSIQGICPPKFEHYEGTDMYSPIEYSAIKAGVIAITTWLAKRYKNSNIRVNCISPGGIKDNQDEIFLRNYRKSCNNKGLLDSEDISGLALFLISDDSLFINGQNLIIDDGWSL